MVAGSDQLASAQGRWTFDMVQEQMVEAVRIWWRTPGRVGPGRGPYAGDGPWELMVREAWLGDYDARGGDGVSSDVPLRSAAMTRADVAARDQASDWLIYVPERDRKLVVMALGQLAGGKSRVSWMALRRPMGVKIGAHGLRRRYTRAIGGIADALNRRKCEGRHGQGLELS